MSSKVLLHLNDNSTFAAILRIIKRTNIVTTIRNNCVVHVWLMFVSIICHLYCHDMVGKKETRSIGESNFVAGDVVASIIVAKAGMSFNSKETYPKVLVNLILN